MNYAKIYSRLYEKAKLRGHEKLQPFMEFHHFVPKSLYFTRYKKLINGVVCLELAQASTDTNADVVKI